MHYDYQYKVTFRLDQPFSVDYVNYLCTIYPNRRILVEVQSTKGISSSMIKRLKRNVSIRIAGGYDEDRISRFGIDLAWGDYYNNAVISVNNIKNAGDRTSFLQTHPGYICLEAVIKLEKGDKNALDEVIKERRQRRMESQPLEYPSAGSVFRNPEGMFAGKLIEDLGLKGKTIGGAQVSTKHSGFIINTGNATTKDILELIDYVREKVYEKHSVLLQTEVKYWS